MLVSIPNSIKGIKRFSRLSLLAISLATTLTSPIVLANPCFKCFEPNIYLGLEGQYNVLKVRNQINRPHQSLFGGGLFAGSRFHENVGIELGANLTQRATIFSATGTVSPAVVGNVDVKAQNLVGYTDLMGYVPCDCLDFIGSLGLGLVNSRLSYRASGTVAPFTSGALSYTDTLFRPAFRLGAGLQFHINECVGTRAMFRYSINGRQINSNNDPFLGKRQEVYQLGLGLFYKF